MPEKRADTEADMDPVVDGGESASLMTPLTIGEGSRQRAELTDLAVELAARSAGFRRSLPASICSALAELVRSMNCYYSVEVDAGIVS